MALQHPRFEDITRHLGRLHGTADLDIAPFRQAPLVLSRLNELKLALNLAPAGLALEFGVFKGTSLRHLAATFPDRRFTGFDSFEGLPEPWVRNDDSTYEAGHFAVEKLPLVPPNTELVKGFFDQTLPGWLARNDGPVGFVHIDCDLYGGAIFVLQSLTERLANGAVIVFDELSDWQDQGIYGRWREGEWRALGEWLAETGFVFRILSRDDRFCAAIQVWRRAEDAPEAECQVHDVLTALRHSGEKALARDIGWDSLGADAPELPLAIDALTWNLTKRPEQVVDRAQALRPRADRPQASALDEVTARALFRLGRTKEADLHARKAMAVRSGDPRVISLAASTARRLGQHDRARVLFHRAFELSRDPVYKTSSEDSARMASIRPEFAKMKFSGLLIQHLCDAHDFETVLDIGSGAGEQTEALRAQGKIVTELDYGESVYFRDRPDGAGQIIRGDFLVVDLPQSYDCIIASHVLEHQLNVQQFLRKVHAHLNEGGVLGLSVPPAKPEIVGGHVTLWNAGLLLYNLVLAGFDCREAWVRKYGYNISVAVKKRSITLPPLEYDNGDIDRISAFLPNGWGEGFNGDITILN